MGIRNGKLVCKNGFLHFSTNPRWLVREVANFYNRRTIVTEPRIFTAVDLTVQGDVQLKGTYDYSSLEQIPGAQELIVTLATALYRSPEEFEIRLGRSDVLFRWRATADTAGIATLRCDGTLASLSLLATGIDAKSDSITLAAFQSHLLRQLHDTGIEPAFGLVNLTERPLVATINFHSPSDQATSLVVALADRCFAAAYFRYHRLA